MFGKPVLLLKVHDGGCLSSECRCKMEPLYILPKVGNPSAQVGDGILWKLAYPLEEP